MLGGVYTTTLLYEYGDFSVRFHTEEMQRLHVVVLSAEVNYARGMWACRFLASTRSSARCAVAMQLRVDRRRSNAFVNLSCEYES